MSAVPEIINPLEGSDWDTLVQAHPEAGLYHESRWLRVLQRAFGVQPFCCVLRRFDGSLRAGMPGTLVASPLTGRRISALPLSEFADPLVEDAADLVLLLKAFRGHGESEQAPSARLRTRNPLPAEAVEGWHLDDSCGRRIISLDGSHSEVMARYASDIRRSVRRAHKAGLKLRRGLDDAILKTFHRLLACTRIRRGLLPQPLKFFHAMRDLFGERLLVSVAETGGGIPIAGSLGICAGETFYGLYAGSNRQFHRLFPNHLLNEAEIADAGAMGLKWFDYGRTQRDNLGLRKFKEKWGAEALPMYTYSLGFQPTPGTGSLSLARRFVPLMPYPAAALAGRLVYPHLC